VSAGWWIAFLAAAVGGAVARYLLDLVVQERTGGGFPWGTCVINISGSFALGLITGAVLYHGFSSQGRFVLGTGFCGAYTTFSTFTFETLSLAESGRPLAAARNVVLSTAGGLAAAAAGLAVAAL
jgi:CrcB protein